VKIFFFGLFILFFFYSSTGNTLPTEIFFQVYRNGDKIGYHKINFKEKKNTIQAIIEIKFEVTFLGFVVYDYFHINKEFWENDLLNNLHTKTDKNGESMFCNLTKKHKKLFSEGSAGKDQLPLKTIPTSYWNHKLVSSQPLNKRVLNTQDCSFIDFKIEKIGEERIYNGYLPSTHFKLSGQELTGEDVKIDIWYDENKNWVKMIFIKDNSKIEYFLDKFHEDAK